jgi:ABC-type spermidine/putrescine transport system permease subunit II
MKSRRWLLGISMANVMFLYGPIAVLIVFSFNSSRLSATWTGATLHWYLELASDRALYAAVQNSLVVAGCSTIIAAMLGVAAAVGLESLPTTRRQAVEGAMLLPLVVPEVMLGVALMLFFVTIKVPLSLLTVTIGHAAFNLPVVMVIVRARLRKIDPHLLQAAYDLGATPWNAFRRVTLPLLAPAILGGVLMAFTISLDDFIVTFFTGGPGSTTLPLKVYSMIKSGVSPEINALSTVLVVLSMALVALAAVLQRRGHSVENR